MGSIHLNPDKELIMSLNAIVYKSIANIFFREGEKQKFLVDEMTGEVFLKDEYVGKTSYQENDFIATQKRIGNLSEINTLKTLIATIIKDNQSIILNKILYNASHSGDLLCDEDINLLAIEIEILRKNASSSLDSELQLFLDVLDILVKASIDEHNPIVFV